MIKLLRVPYKLYNTAELIEYLAYQSISLLPSQLRSIEASMDYYKVYAGSRYIGVVVGHSVDDFWYAHRVHLYKKFYFKEVIAEVQRMVVALGLTGIVILPNKHTAQIYSKHKIARRL